MTMKRITAFLVAAIALIAATSCNGEGTASADTAAQRRIDSLLRDVPARVAYMRSAGTAR